LITINRGDRNVFSCHNIGAWKFSIVVGLVIENFGCQNVWWLKKFGLHTLWRSKIILITVPCAEWIFFQLPQGMVIEFFQLP
jgi:hypothetical protein